MKLKPTDWKSGEHCWIVDVVAPFHGAAGFLEAIRESVLAEHEVRVLRYDPETKARRMEILGGARADEIEPGATGTTNGD